MFKNLSVRSKRVWPALVGLSALTIATLIATLGVGAASEASGQQVAEANRAAEQTATRGAARTNETTSTVAVPTTEVPATTTTAAPVVTTTTSTTEPPETTTTEAPASDTGNSQSGGASYYAQPWANKGCAHKSIAKGTVLTVTNVATGKSVSCVVNDRGPYIAGRIIDLDTTIFKQFASTRQGVFQAKITW